MKKLVFTGSVALCVSLFAQTIDFKIALNAVLVNNKQLLAKKLDVKYTELTVDEVDAQKFGSLVINENFSRTNHAGAVFSQKLSSRRASFDDFGFGDFTSNSKSPTLLSIQPQNLNNPTAINNFESTIEYSLPIFTGFRLQNMGDTASKMLQASKLGYAYNEKKLCEETLRAYNGAVAAREYMEAAKINKTSALSLLRLSQELSEVGISAKIDTLQAKAYDAQSEAALAKATAAYLDTLEYLKLLTGVEDITAVSSLQSVQIDFDVHRDIVKSALESREDLAQSHEMLSASMSRAASEKSSFYPNVTAFAKYGFNDNILSLSGSRDFYTVGIGVSYTLFDGGSRSAKYQKAVIEAQKERLQNEHLAQAVKMQAITSKIQALSSEKQVEQRRIQLELADDVAQKYRLMYQNGLGTMSDLVAKEALVADARAQFIASRYDESIAKAAFKTAIGQSIKENR